MDAGTYQSLLDASEFVQTIEHRQGPKIACLEEIAWRNGWVSENEILTNAKKMLNNSYSKYLMEIIQEKVWMKNQINLGLDAGPKQMIIELKWK